MNLKKFLFTKKYGSLYYRLSYFFKHKIPFTKAWNEYHNPFIHWWKARAYFKRPKSHFHIGKIVWFFGFPIRKDYLNSIIDIRLSSLGWKNKYTEYRHEWDPYISIVFFRKWQLLWVFNWENKSDKNSNTRSMATWEALLDFIYTKKNIQQCIKSHIWSNLQTNEDITIEPNLK